VTSLPTGIDPRWPHGKQGPYAEPHPQVLAPAAELAEVRNINEARPKRRAA